MVMEFTLNKVAGCGNADLLETGDCVTSCLYFFLNFGNLLFSKIFPNSNFPIYPFKANFPLLHFIPNSCDVSQWN